MQKLYSGTNVELSFHRTRDTLLLKIRRIFHFQMCVFSVKSSFVSIFVSPLTYSVGRNMKPKRRIVLREHSPHARNFLLNPNATLQFCVTSRTTKSRVRKRRTAKRMLTKLGVICTVPLKPQLPSSRRFQSP